MPMIVPVVGTVGVPARYGGFETLAEQLCANYSAHEVQLVVYCEKQAYAPEERKGDFHGHRRVFLPLRANGVSSMLYDAWALLHAVFVLRARDIYVLGYSGAWILPLLKLLRPGTRYIVNVDGMEWRRDKFSRLAKRLLKLLEYCAARSASTVIADNQALATLFSQRYHRKPITIAYGGDHTVTDAPVPATAPQGHYLAIARIEPENNTHVILKACRDAGVPLVFIGNWNATDYGRDLRRCYAGMTNLTLLDPIYAQTDLNIWRAGAIGYIHGHSVGGTNPSLVEAIFHSDRLLSFDCEFNRATLDDAGAYFTDAASLAALLRTPVAPIAQTQLHGLRDRYCWPYIAESYAALLGRSAALQ